MSAYLTIKEYEDKFGKTPMIPFMRSNGTDKKFLKMVQEAIDRGTPLTEDDYEKYYPTDPDVLY